jgi:GNAT superfamily N-acetyltransferase
VIEVRRANDDDVSALAGVLARAFEDDPVSTYAFPDDRRRRRALPRFFEIELSREYMSDGEIYTTQDLAGAALWGPPGKRRQGLRSVLGLVPLVPSIGWSRLPRVVRGLASIEACHPKQPHFYLGVLGTDPPEQGRGVGSALLAPVLDLCDTEGVPAYLESSKEENVPFYSRHGFTVTSEITLPGPGPKLWLMWRDPRPDGAEG